MTGPPDSPLSRWSRRKLAARGGQEATEAAEAAPAPPDDAVEELVAEGAPAADAEPFDESTLPDPETLQAGDDFTAYLGRHVSAGLRRRALRRLWTTNPVLANLDGLNDYDTDYTDLAHPPGLLQTAYKVGRGLLGEDDEATRSAAGEDETEPAPPDAAAAGPAAAQPAAPEVLAPPAEEPPTAAAAPPPVAELVTEAEAEEVRPPSSRRRMRFTPKG